MPKNTNSLTQYNEWIRKSIEWAKGHKNWKNKKKLSHVMNPIWFYNVSEWWCIVYTICHESGHVFLCVCRNCISLMDPCGRWSVSPQHFPSDNNNTRARMKKKPSIHEPPFISDWNCFWFENMPDTIFHPLTRNFYSSLWCTDYPIQPCNLIDFKT